MGSSFSDIVHCATEPAPQVARERPLSQDLETIRRASIDHDGNLIEAALRALPHRKGCSAQVQAAPGIEHRGGLCTGKLEFDVACPDIQCPGAPRAALAK